MYIFFHTVGSIQKLVCKKSLKQKEILFFIFRIRYGLKEMSKIYLLLNEMKVIMNDT